MRNDEVGTLVTGYNEMLTAIVDREEQLNQLAYCDPLTGLANQEKLRQLVSRSGTFVLVAINRLTIIKSMYGVSYAEEIIVDIANTLKKYESDQVKFLGFMVMSFLSG